MSSVQPRSLPFSSSSSGQDLLSRLPSDDEDVFLKPVLVDSTSERGQQRPTLAVPADIDGGRRPAILNKRVLLDRADLEDALKEFDQLEATDREMEKDVLRDLVERILD